ncbi:MAG: SxtJ family membrane protein [Pseudomonadota bacterium]
MSENQGHVEVKMGSERGFAIVFAIVFGLVAIYPVFFGNDFRIWAGVVAAVILALGFLAPKVLAPLNKLWFKFGMLLGAVIAPIVMSIVYFLTVTPTGFIMRGLGYDLLRQKMDPEAKSYWIERDRAVGPMKNQF